MSTTTHVNAVTVYAEYCTGCFCQKPSLPSIETAWEPRFQFARAVKQLAHKIGAGNIRFSTGKTAIADFPAPCHHFPVQTIRFDWRLGNPRPYIVGGPQ